MILFLRKIEYVFYFLLASRSLVDIIFGLEVGNVRMTNIIGVLLVVLFSYYIIVVSKYNIFHLFSHGVNKIFGIFLIVAIPSILFTESKITGMGYWFRAFQGFLFLNLTVLVIVSGGMESFKKRANIIIWCVISSIIVPYVLFIKNLIAGEAVKGTGDIDRYASFAAHYNIFSYLLVIVLAYCLFKYSTEFRNSRKLLWGLVLTALSWAIYINYTRNAWLGMAVLFMAWSIVRNKLFIAAIVLVSAFLLVAFSPTVQDRLSDISAVFSNDSFLELDSNLGSGRIGIWQNNIRHFIEKSTVMEKLFGNGYAVRLAKSRGNLPMSEHNNYLTLLIQTGICGLVAYMFYILMLFRESFRLLKRTADEYFINLAQLFIALLFCYLSLCLFDHMIWNLTFQYYFSVMAGLIVASNIMLDQSIQSKAN